jgi:hypothetical protein
VGGLTEPGLAEKLVAVHRMLEAAAVPHAFGGALALAYCTAEPRATMDLDVNVFVPPAEVDRVADGLEPAVAVDAAARSAVRRDGQVRVWWGLTPVDLFFDVHDFHRRARAHVRVVPFGDETIPVLGCDDLAVFKAMYGRAQDWVDIEVMAAAAQLDAGYVTDWLARLLGAESEVVARVRELLGGS